MTTEETILLIRRHADRQEAFAEPVYTHLSEENRTMFRHAAAMLRAAANEIERTAKEQPK